MKKTKKMNEKGITLIALVVTIVVLIILATVSINAVFGGNGIIKKAKQAKDIQANAIKAEEESMNKLLQEYDNIIASPSEPVVPELPDISQNTPAGTQVKIPTNLGWTSNKVTAISNGNGSAIPLPNGFYYVGGDINTGLVISDKQKDTMDASGTGMGNQFVWIPVSSEENFTRTLFDAGQPVSGLKTDTNDPDYYQINEFYIEPYENGSGESNQYNTMKSQVLKYGGFYIGRFEAGINSTSLRTTYSEAQTVVCKKGVAPYNYVPWGNNYDDKSEVDGQSGAVYLAENFITQNNYESVLSTLCYGCQWDAMCRYIGDNNRSESSKNTVELTGSVTSDVSKNIFDLAGNCREWTMELSYYGNPYDRDYGRTFRGNYYQGDIDVPICKRDYSGASNCDSYTGFRVTLYIK